MVSIDPYESEPLSAELLELEGLGCVVISIEVEA